MIEEFRTLLAKLIVERGLSHKEVALMLDVDPSLISKYLSGEALPNKYRVKEIAEKFNIDEEYLKRVVDFSRYLQLARKRAGIESDASLVLFSGIYDAVQRHSKYIKSQDVNRILQKMIEALKRELNLE